jgi:hypothetical protein
MSGKIDKAGSNQGTATDSEMQEALKVMRAMGQRVALPTKWITKHKNSGSKVTGYSFDLGNPWYTIQPVSTISSLDVKINNFQVDPDSVSIIIREQMIPVKAAKTIHELWWGFGELAQVYIEGAALDEAILRKTNDLEVRLDMRSVSGYGLPGDHVDFVFQRRIGVN